LPLIPDERCPFLSVPGNAMALVQCPVLGGKTGCIDPGSLRLREKPPGKP
jgi:hypothetical protein